MTGTYNLLDEPWLPVRSQSGTRRWIRPAEVATRQDPALYIDSGRPDFDGALTQFLIGLLQTCAAPPDQGSWRKWMREPPAVEQLDELFAPVRHAFFLDGDGPRFMQDLSLRKSPHRERPDRLLLDGASNNAIDQNKDLFVKRRANAALSLSAGAAALFTFQTYTKGYTGGHYGALLGGNQLTTVLLARDLWLTAWLNVLEEPDARAMSSDLNESCFPWLGSEPKEIFSHEAHPAHAYWAMPFRAWLHFAPADGKQCGVFGCGLSAAVTAFSTGEHGNRYRGAWRHPLVPASRKDLASDPMPVRAEPNAKSYGVWPRVHFAGHLSEPAQSITYYYNSRFDACPEARVRVSGYYYKKKGIPAAWIEAQHPIIGQNLAELGREHFARLAEGCIQARESVLGVLHQQLKDAWRRRALDFKKNQGARVKNKDFETTKQYVAGAFDSATESSFYRTLTRVAECLHSGADPTGALEAWLESLARTAHQIFQEMVPGAPGSSADAPEVKRVAIAWNNLVKLTSPRGKKLRGLVELGPPKKEPKREAHQQEAVADV